MKLGATDISNIKLGAADASKVYLGSSVVWMPSAPIGIEETFDYVSATNVADLADFDQIELSGSQRLVAQNGFAQMIGDFNQLEFVTYNGTLPNNQFAECDISTYPTAGSNWPLTVRTTDANNFYGLIYAAGYMTLEKIVNGVRTDLTTWDDRLQNAGTTTTWRLEADGTTLRVYRDGVLSLTKTDSDLATGVAGVKLFGGTTTSTVLARFQCGAL